MRLRARRPLFDQQFNATGSSLNNLLKVAHAIVKLLSGVIDSRDHESYAAQVSNQRTSMAVGLRLVWLDLLPQSPA